MSKIRIVETARPEARGPFVRVARVFLLVGVWTLVGFAALSAWMRMAP